MAWIKQNVLFVISCAVALGLLIFAIVWAMSKSSEENALQEELNAATQEYQNLNSASPFPSAENVTAAKAEQQRLKEFRKQLGSMFVPAPTFPKMDDQAFKGHLEQVIAELRNAASKGNVALPENFSFTFSNHRLQLQLRDANIEAWLSQLADIRELCSILYQARISALDGLQRVPVNAKYDAGTAEFLATGITTNQMGTFTPYVLTFRTFTPELASVLEGLSRSTNFIIVKSVNVMPSTVPLPVAATATPVAQATQTRAYVQPTRPYPDVPSEADRYAEGPRRTYPTYPTATPRPVPGQRPAAAAQPVTVLAERPLQVTIMVDVVKLNNPQ